MTRRPQRVTQGGRPPGQVGAHRPPPALGGGFATDFGIGARMEIRRRRQGRGDAANVRRCDRRPRAAGRCAGQAGDLDIHRVDGAADPGLVGFAVGQRGSGQDGQQRTHTAQHPFGGAAFVGGTVFQQRAQRDHAAEQLIAGFETDEVLRCHGRTAGAAGPSRSPATGGSAPPRCYPAQRGDGLRA